jgi:uncharacterized Zn-binding protein involved in type VI secretion
MPEAARLSDPIGHSPTMSWLLKGLLIGAGIALVGIAIVGTGGLAAVAIVGGLAAAGAGVGEVMSTMSFAAKEVVGQIILGSTNVFIQSLAAARAHIDTTMCSKHPNPPKLIATGSGNVYINGLPAARMGDKTICSAEITKGASKVFIGGGTQQTDTMEPENLVPGWVHAALLVVGVASAIVLAGPIVAAGGLFGGFVGGIGGNWLGGKIFGEGSDGQKWSMLAGSFLGGWAGAKGAPKAWEFAKRIEVDPNALGMNGGNLRLKPPTPVAGIADATAESQAAYGRAQQAQEGLGKTFEKKTTASDGDKTLSGWSQDKPPGFAHGKAEDVRAMSNEIGHDLKPHVFDKDFPGQYNASHAEKQLSILKPGDPMGSSRPVCSDCQSYLSKFAQHHNVEQVVTDPNGTWIFKPDGTVVGPK